MSLTIPNRDLTAGLAGQWSDTIDPNADPFITGDQPPQVTVDYVAADSTTIPARTVVGRVGNVPTGKITPAVWNATPGSGVIPIGITVYAITTGASNTAQVGVYRQGVFNPDRLNWDASFDTDEKKRLAFEYAGPPTAIVLRKPTAMTPAAPL